ncbi:MAG: septum formation inhibitor Maf [Sideroxydans sp.]|nr:septum formation inhibitor Maf [Sideroxydans sp.]
MTINQPRIYLASQSPRRRELLKQIGIHYEVFLLRNNPTRQVDVDEVALLGEAPQDYVERVCREKSEQAWAMLQYRNLPAAPILTADTTVTIDGHILGKPENAAHAKEMLRLLSGRTHQVLTAVGIIEGGHYVSRLSSTRITFASLDEARINQYVASGEANDKAGSYGIQGRAGAFVTQLEGSYSGVVGLPLFETVELLNTFGIMPS